MVATSDLRGAGTDGDVYLSLTGDGGAMGETQLVGPRNAFSRGNVDVFTLSGSELGRIKAATVRLHARGIGAAWHLATIEVMNKANGSKVRLLWAYGSSLFTRVFKLPH
jgi:hypothetical protein